MIADLAEARSFDNLILVEVINQRAMNERAMNDRAMNEREIQFHVAAVCADVLPN